MKGYQLDTEHAKMGVAEDAGADNTNALLMPPSGISREDSTEVHLTTPLPHRVPLFSTDDDLVIIRRVYDSIERIEVAS